MALRIPRQQANDEMALLERRGFLAHVVVAQADATGEGEGEDIARSYAMEWMGEVALFLRQRFNTYELGDEWQQIVMDRVQIRGELENAINAGRRYLERLRVRLRYFDTPEQTPERSEPLPEMPEHTPETSTATAEEVAEVFVVHGHNSRWRTEVTDFVRQIGPSLRLVILRDEPNTGRTLLEKFESHASNVAYALVILTPDDVGASSTDFDRSQPGSALTERARQNVVFELGYFFGLIGRSRVAALYREGTEKPSDIDGLVYIPLDDEGAWKLILGREMKASGLDVDLHR